MSVEKNQFAEAPNEGSEVQLGRVLTGMQDALTDEMVGRLAATASVGADLLDQLGRSGVDKALPILAQMVDNGDLQRIAELARLIGAAQDATTDEMVVRGVEMISQSLSLLDRLNRSGMDRLVNLLPRIVALLERIEQQRLADDLLQCLEEAGAPAATPSSPGGLRGLWSILREPETQDALRYMLTISRQFRACRVRQPT